MSAASEPEWLPAKGHDGPKRKRKSDVAKPVKKFTMSPAARAKIAKAQKARWAKAKREAAQMEASAMPKKRTMSPAARAKIAKLRTPSRRRREAGK